MNVKIATPLYVHLTVRFGCVSHDFYSQQTRHLFRTFKISCENLTITSIRRESCKEMRVLLAIILALPLTEGNINNLSTVSVLLIHMKLFHIHQFSISETYTVSPLLVLLYFMGGVSITPC